MQSYKVYEMGTIKRRYTEGVLFRGKWYIKGRYSHGNYILYECYFGKKVAVYDCISGSLHSFI